MEPFELERLVVFNEESEEIADDEVNSSIEEESSLRFISNSRLNLSDILPKYPTSFSNFSILRPGHVARAASLCLFNTAHMGQLSGSETSNMNRYSIQLHSNYYYASASFSKRLFQQAHRNVNDSDTNKQKSEILETTEDKESTSNSIERSYDGLTLLDETRLDEMVETDLVSSINI